MNEFWVDVLNKTDGITLKIKDPGNVFDYIKHRRFLSEEICISLINEIQKKFNKKVAVIFGNCQTRKLQYFLINNPTFSKNYFFIHIPGVHVVIAAGALRHFQEDFWSYCDLLICQHVKKDNFFSPILATDNLPSKLSKNAKVVWIPNVYFDGYFPQYTINFGKPDIKNFWAEWIIFILTTNILTSS